MKNIYLIGMPGCGKTTIAKKLQKKLNLKVIDLDEYIEEHSGMFIDEIFEQYGEQYFRDLETNFLKEFKDQKDIIISTGGGIIKNESNKLYMNGIVIYLDCRLELLESRLKEDTKRPLLKTNSIKELYIQRLDKYIEFSDAIIENEDAEACVQNILEVLDEKNISN